MNPTEWPELLSRRHFLQTTSATAIAVVSPSWGDDERNQDDSYRFLHPSKRQMRVLSVDPPNAEPDFATWGDWQTPTSQFFVRSHAVPPRLEAANYSLQVTGLVQRELSLSLSELRSRFARHAHFATLVCAGNRRQEHAAVRPVAGVAWGLGGISTAHWQGYVLADILRHAGVRAEACHVQFEGTDIIAHPEGDEPFGGSIPLERAMATEQWGQTGPARRLPSVMLADCMNQQPLLPDHGFPLRVIVPGFIGARSVKWLRKIIVSDRPSSNHYMQRAYKVVANDTLADWSAAASIEEMPINSAITQRPRQIRQLPDGSMAWALAGYAIGQGGTPIRDVEYSADGGRDWQPLPGPRSPSRPGVWLRWRTRRDGIVLPAEAETIMVRATDSAGNMQPASVPWNVKGYLYNAWHQVRLRS